MPQLRGTPPPAWPLFVVLLLAGGSCRWQWHLRRSPFSLQTPLAPVPPHRLADTILTRADYTAGSFTARVRTHTHTQHAHTPTCTRPPAMQPFFPRVCFFPSTATGRRRPGAVWDPHSEASSGGHVYFILFSGDSGNSWVRRREGREGPVIETQAMEWPPSSLSLRSEQTTNAFARSLRTVFRGWPEQTLPTR